jgi:CBS domain-containing protein
MYAKDVMSSDVVSIAATATIFDAARLMVNTRVSGLPVVDENGRMVGVVSEVDLIRSSTSVAKEVGFDLLGAVESDARAAAAVEHAKSARVSEVMTKGAISAHETATLREVADLMLKHRIKRVPIVRDDRLLGIVSRADLLKALISFGAPAKGSTLEPPKAADQAIRAAVFAAVRGHDWSRALWFDAVVSKGVVHLWGVAPSNEVRQAYEDTVGRVPGVTAVTSHMHIGSAAVR